MGNDYEKANKNNKVTISGRVLEKPEFSHSVMGENFFEILLEVSRLSEQTDKIPVTISDRLVGEVEIGEHLTIEGQFRSYNKQDDNKSKLVLTVFAREIEKSQKSQCPNNISLTGFVCKEPIYRTTPFGREIADILLAVNRAYGKSDYIPCIAWGRNAKFVSGLKIGDPVLVSGRIQSREYQKRFENGEVEIRTAYEVSINQIEELKLENE